MTTLISMSTFPFSCSFSSFSTLAGSRCYFFKSIWKNEMCLLLQSILNTQQAWQGLSPFGELVSYANRGWLRNDFSSIALILQLSCTLSGCRDPNQPVWRRRRRLWLQPHRGEQLRAQQGHRGAVQWGRGGEGGGGLRWRRNARVSPKYIEILQASGGKSMPSLNLIYPWNHFRRQWFYQLMEWWLETHSSSRCKVKESCPSKFSLFFLDKVPKSW